MYEIPYMPDDRDKRLAKAEHEIMHLREHILKVHDMVDRLGILVNDLLNLMSDDE